MAKVRDTSYTEEQYKAARRLSDATVAMQTAVQNARAVGLGRKLQIRLWSTTLWTTIAEIRTECNILMSHYEMDRYESKRKEEVAKLEDMFPK